MRLSCSLLFLLFAVIPDVFGITFYLSADTTKCIREEVHKDVLVVGEYNLNDAPYLRTDIMVRAVLYDHIMCGLHVAWHNSYTQLRFIRCV